MFKYIIIFISFSTFIFSTRCCDGTYSSSTGRGTCSHHGGVCDSGYSSNSNSYYSTIPKTPTNLEIKYINNQNIKLSWNYVDNSDFYKIYYSIECRDNNYIYLDKSYLEYYFINPEIINNNKIICFKIKACNYNYCSSYSNSIKYTNTNYINNSSSSSNSTDYKIIDGNTIEFANTICVLYGIDSPEINNSYKLENECIKCQIDKNIMIEAGKQAKLFLERLTNKEELKIQSHKKDRNGIEICNILKKNDNIDLSKAMLKNGYAVVWKEHIQDNNILNEYKKYENDAKNTFKGLWDNFYTAMSCLSNGKSSFQENENISFYEFVIFIQNIDDIYKKIKIKYIEDNFFTIDKNCDFQIGRDIFEISNSINKILLQSDGEIKILNKYKNNLFNSFKTSLYECKINYVQSENNNVLEYFLEHSIKFSIFYQKNVTIVKHNNNSKFSNDINISTNNKIWIDKKNNLQTLNILIENSNEIEF